MIEDFKFVEMYFAGKDGRAVTGQKCINVANTNVVDVSGVLVDHPVFLQTSRNRTLAFFKIDIPQYSKKKDVDFIGFESFDERHDVHYNQMVVVTHDVKNIRQLEDKGMPGFEITCESAAMRKKQAYNDKIFKIKSKANLHENPEKREEAYNFFQKNTHPTYLYMDENSSVKLYEPNEVSGKLQSKAETLDVEFYNNTREFYDRSVLVSGYNKGSYHHVTKTGSLPSLSLKDYYKLIETFSYDDLMQIYQQGLLEQYEIMNASVTVEDEISEMFSEHSDCIAISQIPLGMKTFKLSDSSISKLKKKIESHFRYEESFTQNKQAVIPKAPSAFLKFYKDYLNNFQPIEQPKPEYAVSGMDFDNDLPF